MGTGLVRRLISALLLALIAAGGGRLSTVDALAFHEVPAETDGFRSHFEASSGCHQDGCSMRSTAHESRPGPWFAAAAIHAVLPETAGAALSAPDAPSPFAPASHLSRAPPFSV
ncbi:MAG TPA: hypothetical protein VJ817_03960 [Gemmatimonadales bacterium]|nr:hypothetical protein [Gemmatimonadales bacterium]